MTASASVGPGFFVIGEEDGGVAFAQAPGAVTVFDEELFEGKEGLWDKGPSVGKGHSSYIRTQRGDRAIVTVSLEFNDGSSLVASGSLPFASSEEGDVLAVTGGTGALSGALPGLRVRVKNPRSYHNE